MNLIHRFRWFPLGGGPMLKTEGRMELEVLRKHGASIRDLTRVTGYSRRLALAFTNIYASDRIATAVETTNGR
jgi:hypothetical protein